MNTGKVWFSYDDKWGINIKKNDRWESLISIVVEKKRKKEQVGGGKRKEKKLVWLCSQRKLNSHPPALKYRNPTH